MNPLLGRHLSTAVLRLRLGFPKLRLKPCLGLFSHRKSSIDYRPHSTRFCSMLLIQLLPRVEYQFGLVLFIFDLPFEGFPGGIFSTRINLLYFKVLSTYNFDSSLLHLFFTRYRGSCLISR